MPLLRKTVTTTRPSTSVPWYNGGVPKNPQEIPDIGRPTMTVSNDGLTITFVHDIDSAFFDRLGNNPVLVAEYQEKAKYDEDHGIVTTVELTPL